MAFGVIGAGDHLASKLPLSRDHPPREFERAGSDQAARLVCLSYRRFLESTIA